MKLLIAEGEPDLAEALTVFFEKNQFTVDAVHDGQDACNYASGGGYDAVILDAMMPKMDGIEVLRRLRSDGFSAPVLLLTAKGEKDSCIPGFDAGADDCLPKPFAPDELFSRVRALLRRAGDHEPAVLTFCGLSLDCAAGTLCCGRETARLSGRELRVMELFMRSPRTLFFGGAHQGAGLGLGQQRRDQRRVGPYFQPAQEAQGRLLCGLHPRDTG